MEPAPTDHVPLSAVLLVEPADVPSDEDDPLLLLGNESLAGAGPSMRWMYTNGAPTSSATTTTMPMINHRLLCLGPATGISFRGGQGDARVAVPGHHGRVALPAQHGRAACASPGNKVARPCGARAGRMPGAILLGT